MQHLLHGVRLLPWIVILVSLGAAATGPAPLREIRILPLGDSITRGQTIPGDVPGGYRTRLYHLLSEHQLAVHFVGGEETNPDPANLPQPHHEGHSGWRIQQLDGVDAAGNVDHHFIANDLAKYSPDVVLIHLGTNDMVGGFKIESAPERLDSLVTAIVTLKPDALIVVAQIISTRDPKFVAPIKVYNQGVATVIKKHVAAGHHVVGVDMSSAIPLENFNDPYHPNQAGFNTMGEVWAEAVLHNITPGQPSR